QNIVGCNILYEDCQNQCDQIAPQRKHHGKGDHHAEESDNVAARKTVVDVGRNHQIEIKNRSVQKVTLQELTGNVDHGKKSEGAEGGAVFSAGHTEQPNHDARNE